MLAVADYVEQRVHHPGRRRVPASSTGTARGPAARS